MPAPAALKHETFRKMLADLGRPQFLQEPLSRTFLPRSCGRNSCTKSLFFMFLSASGGRNFFAENILADLGRSQLLHKVPVLHGAGGLGRLPFLCLATFRSILADLKRPQLLHRVRVPHVLSTSGGLTDLGRPQPLCRVAFPSMPGLVLNAACQRRQSPDNVPPGARHRAVLFRFVPNPRVSDSAGGGGGAGTMAAPAVAKRGGDTGAAPLGAEVGGAYNVQESPCAHSAS